MPRQGLRWLVLPFLAAAGIALLPEGGLACAQPVLRSIAPDGRHVLTVCRTLGLPFAMPGQGSDGPGVVVLRDARGRISGAVAMDTLLELGHPPEWGASRMVLPLVAEFDLPARDPSPASGWLADRLWRLRNLAWLLPRSAEFR